MSLASLVIGALVLAGSPQPPPTDPALTAGSLRWVRGHVTAVSTTRLTLKLRDSDLALIITPGTVVGASAGARAVTALAAGTFVEAHYSDRKGVRNAVLVIADVPDVDSASKRPGRSFRGLVRQSKRSTLKLRVENKNREVTLDKRTRLIDTGGQSLAVGAKEVSSRLSGGEEVLVTYVEQNDDMMVNDILISGSSLKALEIRQVRGPRPAVR
jgi:hypothetical protein